MSSEASGGEKDDEQNRADARPRWRLLARMGWLAAGGGAADPQSGGRSGCASSR